MGRIIGSRQADDDMFEIWSFIAGDNLQAADNLAREIHSVCKKIADLRLAGRAREDLGPNLRSVPHGSFVIFYRPQEDGIFVVRVLHGARDLSGLF